MMDDAEELARRKRAEARAGWPGKVTTLEGMECGAYVPGTPEDRLRILHALSERAWALSGKPWPSKDRSTWPGKVIRPWDA